MNSKVFIGAIRQAQGSNTVAARQMASVKQVVELNAAGTLAKDRSGHPGEPAFPRRLKRQSDGSD